MNTTICRVNLTNTFVQKNRSLQATLDLHFFVREDAVKVVTVVLQALRARQQTGRLAIVTGRGNHSRHSKAVIKPAVLAQLKQLGFSYELDERNEGSVLVLI